MPEARIDTVVIAGGLFAWIAIFVASAQGMLHVSWIISDGILALLGIAIAHRLWRIYRRRSRKGA